MHKVDYQNRLLALGLDSHELRRLRADLTLTYQILFGLIDVDRTNLFDVDRTNLFDVDRTNLFNIYNGPPLRGTFVDYAATHNGLILVFTCLVPVL